MSYCKPCRGFGVLMGAVAKSADFKAALMLCPTCKNSEKYSEVVKLAAFCGVLLEQDLINIRAGFKIVIENGEAYFERPPAEGKVLAFAQRKAPLGDEPSGA